jgi:hypothetical protein
MEENLQQLYINSKDSLATQMKGASHGDPLPLLSGTIPK